MATLGTDPSTSMASGTSRLPGCTASLVRSELSLDSCLLTARLRDMSSLQPEPVQTSLSSRCHHISCCTVTGQGLFLAASRSCHQHNLRILLETFLGLLCTSFGRSIPLLPRVGGQEGGLGTCRTWADGHESCHPHAGGQDRRLQDECLLGRASTIMCLHFITNIHN